MQTDNTKAAANPGSWSNVHPVTVADRTTMAGMRAMIEPNKGKLRGIAARGPYDVIMGRVLAPEAVSFRRDTVGGVAGWWCEPVAARPDAAILHAHGGWFNWGSSEGFRHLVGHIARSAGTRAFVADYRLAPEFPFPAAFDDIVACYDGLLESGVRSIAVTGDSAGGNLALGLLARLTSQPARTTPVAAVALSPVTDLAFTGASWSSRAAADPYFVRDQAEELVRDYLGGHGPFDPLASPLYGDLAGLPPLRVHVGDDEVLLDDSLRYAKRAAAAGVDARVDVWEGMPHGFIAGVGKLDAAAAALDAIGTFLSDRFTAARM